MLHRRHDFYPRVGYREKKFVIVHVFFARFLVIKIQILRMLCLLDCV
jgi:hypothetical protein